MSSFWARIDGFQDSDVLSQLKPGGGLVRTWAIRSTMHTIPTKDYHVYVLGGAGERLLNWIDTLAKKRGYPPREERRRLLVEPVLEEIKGRAVTEEEIKALVSPRARRLGLREGVWTGIGDMTFSGLLVHAGKRGSRSLYMRSDDWIPGLKPPLNRQTYRLELLRRYLAQHGPASKEDIMYWAYLTRQQLDESLAGLASEIAELKPEPSTEPLIALERGVDQKFPRPPRAVVLPKYDSLMLTLKDKSRFMDMRYYRRVFGALGMVRPTVLVDGFVAAIWRKIMKRTGVTIEVHALKKVLANDRKAVEQRFRDYRKYAGLDVSVRWVRGKWVHLPSR